MNQKPLRIELSDWDRAEIHKLLAKRVSNWNITQELRFILEQRLTDELVESVIEKAMAKAIKDVARWKLLREANLLDETVLQIIRRNRHKLVTY